MTVSTRARTLIAEFEGESAKMGDIKKRAKEIKTDHALAEALWASERYLPRLLATLVLDKKQLTQSVVETMAADVQQHSASERDQLAEWLLANQLMKSKTLTALLEGWALHPIPILRRLFWYHQARLRWTGQTPPPNSGDLLNAIEKSLPTEAPEVQWAMNFCAAQIGVHEPKYRARCIKLGTRVGLYKDDKVPKNCTPSYLPEFIRIEAAKREGG